MSLLDVYCRFEGLGNTRSKARLDLQKQNKAWIYLMKVPEHIRGNRERKSEHCLVGSDERYISGVFIPENTRPEIERYNKNSVFEHSLPEKCGFFGNTHPNLSRGYTTVKSFQKTAGFMTG